MDDVQRQLDERHFIEDFGLYTEQLGFPRMAGRILGWLLISDPPHQSAGQLGEMLGASKGSVSGMTRLLIQIGLVELVSLPGERRDYYRISSNAWANSLKERLEQAHAFRRLAEEGLALLKGSNPQRLLRLEEMQSLYALLEGELPKLLERWQSERKGMES